VILTEPDWDIWLGADTRTALALQRLAANEIMRIVARGGRSRTRRRSGVFCEGGVGG
jgi:hypothetical protein